MLSPGSHVFAACCCSSSLNPTRQVRQRIASFYDGLYEYRQIFCPTCHEQWPSDRRLPEETPEHDDGTPIAECTRLVRGQCTFVSDPSPPCILGPDRSAHGLQDILPALMNVHPPALSFSQVYARHV